MEGFIGDAELGAALEGADLVVIPAGVPRKPGMTRDDLFNINAGIVKTLVTACAKHCPNVSPPSLCALPQALLRVGSAYVRALRCSNFAKPYFPVMPRALPRHCAGVFPSAS